MACCPLLGRSLPRHFGSATDQAAWMCSASARIVPVPETHPHCPFGRTPAVEVLAPPARTPAEGSAPLPWHPHLRSRAKIVEILITPN